MLPSSPDLLVGWGGRHPPQASPSRCLWHLILGAFGASLSLPKIKSLFSSQKLAAMQMEFYGLCTMNIPRKYHGSHGGSKLWNFDGVSMDTVWKYHRLPNVQNHRSYMAFHGVFIYLCPHGIPWSWTANMGTKQQHFSGISMETQLSKIRKFHDLLWSFHIFLPIGFLNFRGMSLGSSRKYKHISHHTVHALMVHTLF